MPASAKSKKRPIQPEDLTKFIFVSDAQVSPNADSVLFVRRHTGEKNESVSNIWIASTNGKTIRQFTTSGKDGHPRWSPDGARIAFISGRNKPKSQIFVMRSDGGEATALTDFPEGSISGFKWSPDGKRLAVSFREQDPIWTEEAGKKREQTGASTPPRITEEMFYRLDGDGYFLHQRHYLYIVNAETGATKKIFDKDKTGWFEFDWSPDGKELVVAANLDRNPLLHPWKSRLYRLKVASGKLKEIPGQFDGSKESPKWSPDGKAIAFAGREGKDNDWGSMNTHLFVCDAKTGKMRNLSASVDYCLSAAVLSDTKEAGYSANFEWTQDSKGLLVNLSWHGESHIALVDAASGKWRQLTKGAVALTLGSRSSNGKVLGLTTGSPLALAEVAIGQFSTSEISVRQLTSFNEALLSELDLVKPESVWISTPDGSKVHTWFLKPLNYSPTKKHPAVLEIHGGPHAQYGFVFFHEFQVLAAKGYMVFYSNPRGSKGYGEAHCDAIRGDWGNKDWIDVQAVANYMRSRKDVDSKRVGVMGGSYGGYMTNWVISHSKEFAAAITDRCVSNLVSMAGNSDFPFVPNRYWKGDPWSNYQVLWSQSPIHYFDKVQTPTLIIHSEGDLRCNVEQGEQVFTALKVRGIPARFVRYPLSTSHGMSRGGPADLRIHRLNEIVNWWGKYLSARPAKKRR